MNVIIPLEPYQLRKGGHGSPEKGMCLLELVAYLAGQPHSDIPPCVSPIVRRIGIGLNDRLDDTRRQLLRPYALRMLGTAGDGREGERRQMCNEWLLHYALPAWLDKAGGAEAAQALRDLPANLSASEVSKAIYTARDEAYAARSEARERLKAKVREELAKRGPVADAVAVADAAADAVADAVAVADAAAVAVADAAADAAAVADAAADAAAVAVAVAAADAAAVAVAVADAAAVAVADAAADAAAVAVAVADAAADGYPPWHERYRTAYDAVYPIAKAKANEIVKPTADETLASALDLFGRMLPEAPLKQPAVEGAEVICGIASA